MKTINCKEITIDLTKHDSRSGASVLAKILFKLFKIYGVSCNFEFSDNIKSLTDAKQNEIKKLYTDKILQKDFEELFSYYKEKNIIINILPE